MYLNFLIYQRFIPKPGNEIFRGKVCEPNMFLQIVDKPRSMIFIMINQGEDAVKDLLLTFQSNFATWEEDEQVLFF